jgi:peptidoglycan glycosyltransferase
MLSALTDWLNGPYAGKTMLILRMAFFACFVVAACWLAVGPKRSATGRGRTGFPMLALLTLIAWCGILAAQFNWQILGARNIAFMRFMRTHNARPASLVRRGTLLDRHGTVLAVDDPRPGAPWLRRYPLGEAAAHAVGYFDVRYGMAGMERAGDSVLSGIGGTARDELARLGRNLLAANQAEGGDLRLTLDARLQRKAHALLQGRRGAIIVMRADGEVLALVSMPAFNPHAPGDVPGDNESAPLLNRALQGLYPPGSTFKIVMATLAGEERLSPRFDCPAEGFRATADARPIRDSEYYIRQREGRVWNGFGRIGLRDGFVHSSNVYFAQLGLACSASAFNSLVNRLGLNDAVVLFESATGRVATGPGAVPRIAPADRRMRSQLAIGQGKMVVTPMHVALWTATVAGGGLRPVPRLVAGGTPPPAERVCSRAIAANVQGLMREAVQHGTGRAADLTGLAVCGKTGTAQAPGGGDHAWFTCFTAAAEPRLVVTVLVERGGYGSRSALPIARALLEEARRLAIIRPAT